MVEKNGIFFINQVIADLRLYFSKENIFSFASPAFVQSGAMEAYLDVFSVMGEHGKYCLPSSPEFSLKKALAVYPQFVTGVYDIAHAFRDEPFSIWHRHQFTMVEWYCKNKSYLDIPQSVQPLLEVMLESGKKNSLLGDGSLEILKDVKVVSVTELFQKILQFELLPNTSFSELEALSKQHHVYFTAQKRNLDHDWVELYTVLFDELIEPHLKKLASVVFVKDYPPLTAAMAKINNNGWASRIECYIRGIEIANGYQEMDDAFALKKFWQKNNQMRLSQNKPIHPIDEQVLQASKSLQNTCGIALGLERTLLALFDQFQIEDFYLPL